MYRSCTNMKSMECLVLLLSSSCAGLKPAGGIDTYLYIHTHIHITIASLQLLTSATWSTRWVAPDLWSSSSYVCVFEHPEVCSLPSAVGAQTPTQVQSHVFPINGPRCMIPEANKFLFHLDMAMWLIFYAVVQLDRHEKQLTIPQIYCE